MAFSVMSNEGQLIVVGDLNQIKSDTGPIYWSIKGEPIDMYDLYYNKIINYNAPVISFNPDTRDDVINLVGETIDDLNDQYYWLVGNAQQGGICFSHADNKAYLHRICDPNSSTDMWDITTPINYFTCTVSGNTEHCMLYLIHTFVRNGVEMTTGFAPFFMYSGIYGYILSNKTTVGTETTQYSYNSVYAEMTNYSGNDFPILVPLRHYPFLNNDGQSIGVQYQDWWSGLDQMKPDPNYDGGSGGDSGGEGEFDKTSDDIPIPELPPDKLLNSGIIKMYSPTDQQMNAFINFIYSAPDAFITNFKKMWVNPMDSIISFGVVPFALSPSTTEVVKFCGVPLSNGGVEVQMGVLSSQYIKVNCGTYRLSKFWDNALDQNNYTKLKLFLPFIGFVSLNADECVGGSITVEYNVDLLTGDCMAFVYCEKQDYFEIDFRGAIYSYKGNVLTQAPLTGNNYAQLYSGVINTVMAVANPTPQSIAGIGKEVLGQKVDVQRSSTISANSGSLGEYTPFLVIERPVQSLADTFQYTEGYPYNQTEKLSNLKGYTEVNIDTFRIDDINDILDEEINELINIMNGGIII